MVNTWSGAVSLCAALLVPGHPMHTSVAHLREGAGAAVEVTIRVFPDDLESAVPGAGKQAADSAVARYVRRGFSLIDRNGRPAPLGWKGLERDGDVLVLRLETLAAGGLSGASVRHGLLSERFEDQVNVVRAAYGGRTATLLFVPGDAAKRLP